MLISSRELNETRSCTRAHFLSGSSPVIETLSLQENGPVRSGEIRGVTDLKRWPRHFTERREVGSSFEKQGGPK